MFGDKKSSHSAGDAVQISSGRRHRVTILDLSSSTSSVELFEVETSQIHVAVRQYVYGEDVFPFVETNLEKLRRQIPVVPLTPGQRVCRIIC
jgi:hypothetical protein